MTPPLGPPAWARPRPGRLALLLAASAVGCGGPSPCVVTGSVLVDERPTEGVYVVFHALDRPSSQDAGSTRTLEDGSFSAVVDAPGESAVTAFWPRSKVEDGDLIEGADIFGGRHRDPSNPVAKVAVREGLNTVPPIKLTSPPRGKSRTSPRR